MASQPIGRTMAGWLVLIATASTFFAAAISNIAATTPQKSLRRSLSSISRGGAVAPFLTNRRQQTNPGRVFGGRMLTTNQRCLTPRVKQETMDAGKEKDAKITTSSVMRRGWRREMLQTMLLAAGSLYLPSAFPLRALAFDKTPEGYVRVQSKLEGYKFVVPDFWLLSKTAGNDAAYENPTDFQQNLFVAISGKTKFDSVLDIGTPEEVARDEEKKILDEFMSTRIGVKRESNVVSATQREGKNGIMYYDIAVQVKSFASRNQLAVSQEDIDKAMELEFDRTYITTIGVANNRIYNLRLQTGTDTYARSKGNTFRTIQDSFEVLTVKCPSLTSCKPNGAKIVKELPVEQP